MTISAQSESGFNVGIDAGKAQLDVVWHETGEHAIVENTVAGIRQLVKRLHKEPVARVVIEATGRYERTFVMAALAVGLPVIVANPLTIRRYVCGGRAAGAAAQAQEGASIRSLSAGPARGSQSGMVDGLRV